MNEKINESVARILNNAGWTCSGGAHEPGNYDMCDDCRESCLEVADVVIRARPELIDALTGEVSPPEAAR